MKKIFRESYGVEFLLLENHWKEQLNCMSFETINLSIPRNYLFSNKALSHIQAFKNEIPGLKSSSLFGTAL